MSNERVPTFDELTVEEQRDVLKVEIARLREGLREIEEMRPYLGAAQQIARRLLGEGE